MHATLPLMRSYGFPALRRGRTETLQVNLGYKCNQSCLHCHVNAGPTRTEMMSAEVLADVFSFLAVSSIRKLDITGGAPELHPRFRDLVLRARELGAHYKRILGETHGVRFNSLFTLANMPIQRFGSTLISKGQFNDYMALLHRSHSDANLESVMCRSLVSVDWQGYVYDCDFNQMLDLPLTLKNKPRPRLADLIGRDVAR